MSVLSVSLSCKSIFFHWVSVNVPLWPLISDLHLQATETIKIISAPGRLNDLTAYSFAGLESILAVKWLKQQEGKYLLVKFGVNQFYRPKTAIVPDFSTKMQKSILVILTPPMSRILNSFLFKWDVKMWKLRSCTKMFRCRSTSPNPFGMIFNGYQLFTQGRDGHENPR